MARPSAFALPREDSAGGTADCGGHSRDLVLNSSRKAATSSRHFTAASTGVWKGLWGSGQEDTWCEDRPRKSWAKSGRDYESPPRATGSSCHPPPPGSAQARCLDQHSPPRPCPALRDKGLVYARAFSNLLPEHLGIWVCPGMRENGGPQRLCTMPSAG